MFLKIESARSVSKEILCKHFHFYIHVLPLCTQKRCTQLQQFLLFYGYSIVSAKQKRRACGDTPLNCLEV
jgi:hypothetical protein